jgi:hypothetical protein
MKRCPQCSFVYLDTDDHCDLDGTLLVHAADSEIDSVSSSNQRKPAGAQRKEIAAQTPGRKALVVAVAVGLVLGVVLFLFYGLNRKTQQGGQVNDQRSGQPSTTPPAEPRQTSTATPTPTPDASPPLNTSSSPSLNSTPSSHPRATREAVSSSPVSTGATSGAKVFIRLTNGARIEADEVWRTKEGFWYRSNGIVTLIKANRVKGLEKVPPKP